MHPNGSTRFGKINTQTGQEYDISTVASCFEKEAPTCIFYSITEVLEILKELPFSQEGYVVKFADGSRAKFKGDEYVKMHRIISGTSPLTLWESMAGTSKVSLELMASIPEEFRDDYEKIAVQLEENYKRLWNTAEVHCFKIHSHALGSWTGNISAENKKDIGLYLKSNPHELNQYVFPFYVDKEGFFKKIWKDIRPTANKL